jgi:hypothetical protein
LAIPAIAASAAGVEVAAQLESVVREAHHFESSNLARLTPFGSMPKVMMAKV